MKKKSASLLLVIAGCCFLPSCDTATPETYFDRAVLNSNLMHGFAGRGLQRELEQPSVKLADDNSGATVPMKRKEIIDNQITSLGASLAKYENSERPKIAGTFWRLQSRSTNMSCPFMATNTAARQTLR
jgi:hypothetical protein